MENSLHGDWLEIIPTRNGKFLVKLCCALHPKIFQTSPPTSKHKPSRPSHQNSKHGRRQQQPPIRDLQRGDCVRPCFRCPTNPCRAPTCKCFHGPVSESLDTNSVVSRGYGTERFVPILLKWTLTGLPEDLLRGIYAYGYESPSAVQSRAIMQICKGRGTSGWFGRS